MFSLRMCESAIFPLSVGNMTSYHRVPPPRFRQRYENFGNSRTFKADKDCLYGFSGPLGLKWRVLGGGRAKWKKGGAMVTPNELVFTFGGSCVCEN